MLARLEAVFHLFDGPLGACGWIPFHFVGSKSIEQDVVGRMHGDQLALQVSREFGHRHSLLFEATLPVLTVLGR